RRGAREEEVADLGVDVDITLIDLVVALGLAAHVHDAEGERELRGDAGHLRIRSAGDVVEHVHAGLSRGARDGGRPGVDGGGDALARGHLDDGGYALDLLLRREFAAVAPRRVRADID